MIPIKKAESESSPASSSSSDDESKRDNLIFWNLLKNDRSKITRIDLTEELQVGYKLMGHGGPVRISAQKRGAGHWALKLQPSEDWTSVYLLNYAPREVKFVRRSTYEGTHDFFLTVELSGCRFTITDTFVLHIAADYIGDPLGSSAKRDVAEFSLPKYTEPTLQRRVSITERPGTQTYLARRGDALADVAREAIQAAWPDHVSAEKKAPTAEKVASLVRPLSAASGTVERAIALLKKELADENIMNEGNANVLAEAVKLSMDNSLEGINKRRQGAAVFGVKTGDTWNYHMLTNDLWHDINPVPVPVDDA